MTPEILILAGPNGAGKTTLLENYALPAGMKTVVADEVSTRYLADGKTRGAANYLAGKDALRRIREFTSARTSFLHETNLGSSFHARMLPKLESVGYQSNLLFVALEHPDLAVQRVAKRVREGGHDVPEGIIRARWKRGLKLFFARYRFIADAWTFYDNTLGSIVVAHGTKVGPARIVRRDRWQMYQSLAEAS